MGKVSSNEPKNGRQRRRWRNAKNKYLKPGALAAHLRESKTSGKACMDLGKKRVAMLNVEQNTEIDEAETLGTSSISKTPTVSSPVRFSFGTPDLDKYNHLQKTPKTPRAEGCESESRLESLPTDVLVKILCHLHHDQLRAVFHVSKKIRKAVDIARQFHFNYTTPDRSRQEMLNTMTPVPTEHWPFVSKGDRKKTWAKSPHTPKAPKHGPRPPSRVKFTDMRQIAAVLFQESSLPSRCLVPSVIPKPLCKSLASNRVLFYEDELCQAVAQNKLR